MKQSKASVCVGIFMGILFATACAGGYSLRKNGEIALLSISLWLGWILISVVAGTLTILFFNWDPAAKQKGTDEEPGVTSQPEKKSVLWQIGGKSFLLRGALLVLLWTPVFLAVYPGFFCYDAQDEYVQVATRVFSTHHPLAHVLLLGGMICGVHKFTDSYNLGIACYTFLQMLFLAGCFSFELGEMNAALAGSRRLGETGKRFIRTFLLLFLGLFPTVVMFVLCSAKDSLFSACLLLSMIGMNRILKGSVEGGNRRDLTCCTITLIAMSLLRHNAFYALIVFCVILGVICLILRKKAKAVEQRVRTLLVGGVGAILIYGVISSGLTAALHANDSEHQELLTVPIQQIARTWTKNREDFTKEQLEFLYRILPEEVLAHYTPELADPVKYAFNNEEFENHKGEFLKLWISMGLRHPMSYLNAWAMTSYGYWYPWTEVNVYRGHQMYTFTYEDSSYFAFETEPPGLRHSMLPGVEEIYRRISLERSWQKIPVLRMLFSMGSLFWLYMLFLVKQILRGRGQAVLVWILPGLIWLTLLLGPTFLPRYTIFLWYLLPLLCMTCLGEE